MKSGMIAWACCNIAIFFCFTALAIHFEAWWIALFAGLFTFTFKRKED